MRLLLPSATSNSPLNPPHRLIWGAQIGRAALAIGTPLGFRWPQHAPAAAPAPSDPLHLSVWAQIGRAALTIGTPLELNGTLVLPIDSVLAEADEVWIDFKFDSNFEYIFLFEKIFFLF